MFLCEHADFKLFCELCKTQSQHSRPVRTCESCAHKNCASAVFLFWGLYMGGELARRMKPWRLDSQSLSHLRADRYTLTGSSVSCTRWRNTLQQRQPQYQRGESLERENTITTCTWVTHIYNSMRKDPTTLSHIDLRREEEPCAVGHLLHSRANAEDCEGWWLSCCCNSATTQARYPGWVPLPANADLAQDSGWNRQHWTVLHSFLVCLYLGIIPCRIGICLSW